MKVVQHDLLIFRMSSSALLNSVVTMDLFKGYLVSFATSEMYDFLIVSERRQRTISSSETVIMSIMRTVQGFYHMYICPSDR